VVVVFPTPPFWLHSASTRAVIVQRPFLEYPHSSRHCGYDGYCL